VIERVIRPGHPEWPGQLNELGPAPRVDSLFVAGLPIPERPLVAVVGSRRPTAAGLDAARSLTRGLAEAGFGVVSGLAAGIDAAAHEAALEAGGPTIAVLGFGLDIDYPRRNKSLKERVLAEGTLVTEYPRGTPPTAFHFPQRNRIIAGLAQATLVVEGGLKSGALITARLALDANRAVFAVPGSIRNRMAAGPNELIRTSQAALVIEVAHIFEELAPGLTWEGPPRLGLEVPEVHLKGDERELIALLDDAPLSPDRMCRELGVGTGAVALALSRLEVRGLTSRKGAGYVITTAGARVRDSLVPAASGREPPEG
jgi:DNA processing protein